MNDKNESNACQRCGEGPLIDVEPNEEGASGVPRDVDYPELCDWCGHMTAKNRDD